MPLTLWRFNIWERADLPFGGVSVVSQTVSHYEILEKIGLGGMGEVFLAEDTKLDRKVALKFLPDLMQQDPAAEKRFLREAKFS